MISKKLERRRQCLARVGSAATSPGECLENLIASRFLPKGRFERIRSTGELPERLRRCARSLLPEVEWRAYGNREQILFAAARARVGVPIGDKSLDVYFLDANAVVYAASVWRHEPRAGWWLDDVIQVSYDCDHGWWLDELVRPVTDARNADVPVQPALDLQKLAVRMPKSRLPQRPPKAQALSA